MQNENSKDIERLIIELKDEDASVRKSAALVLGESKDPRAVEPLLAIIIDESRDVRLTTAVSVLEKMGIVTVEPLIKALGDRNRNVRLAAVWVLGKTDDPRAMKSLITMLKDENAEVRTNAAEGLEKMGWTPSTKLEQTHWLFARQQWAELAKKGALTVDLLIIALKDSNMGVGYGAARVLTEIGKKLGNPRSQSVSEAIHLLVDLKARDALTSVWSITKEVLLRDVKSNEFSKIEKALYAFISIGNIKIIPELKKSLNKNGTKTLVEAYLNCGHNELQKAAELWAREHGYTVKIGTGAHPVAWGRW